MEEERSKFHIWILGVVGINTLHTIVLLVVLASRTFKARADHWANTNPVARLELADLRSDTDDLADDFVTWDDRL